MTADPYADALASAPRPMTAAFLRSDAYHSLMERHTFSTPDDDHEASTPGNRSYLFRHATAAPALGVWRWRGMHRNLTTLLDLIGDGAGAYDFGGAAAPLGLGSTVIDTAKVDAHGAPVFRRDITTVRDARVIFSSHTLEHVETLYVTTWKMREALRDDGTLLLHLPSWTCERWRAGSHQDSGHGVHRWTFGLEPSQPYPSYVSIARLAEGTAIEIAAAEYCGDDSIMVIAKRRD